MSDRQILQGRKFIPNVFEKPDPNRDRLALINELTEIKNHFLMVKNTARVRMIVYDKEDLPILTTRTGMLIVRPFKMIASRFAEASKQRADAQDYIQKVVEGIYGQDSQEFKSLSQVMKKNEGNWLNRDIDTEALKKALGELKIPEPEIPEPPVLLEVPESPEFREFPEFPQVPESSEFPEPPQELTINLKLEEPCAAPQASHYSSHRALAASVTLELEPLIQKNTESASTRMAISLGSDEFLKGVPIRIHMDADGTETTSTKTIGTGQLPMQAKNTEDFDADIDISKERMNRMLVPEGIKATYFKKPYMIDNADVFIIPKGALAGNESRVLIKGFWFSDRKREVLANSAGSGQFIKHEQNVSVRSGSSTQTSREFLVIPGLALARDNALEQLKKTYAAAIETAVAQRADKNGDCAIVLIPYFSAMSASQGIEKAQDIDAQAIAEVTLEMRKKHNNRLQILVTTASMVHKSKITAALVEKSNTPG